MSINPSLSFNIFLQGTIGKWLVKEGDSAAPGDALAEIETDKASMAFECTDDMVIAKFLVAEGTEVKVGDPIMVTVEEGDISAFSDFVAPGGAGAPAAAPAPTTAPAAAPAAAAAAASAPTPAAVPRAAGERVAASPLARRLAREAGVDITTLSGTGFGGRIVAADVSKAPAGGVAPVAPSGAARAVLPQAGMVQGTGGSGVYSDFELSELARGVADRYTHAKQVVPHYYLSVELNMEKLVQMRSDLGGEVSVLNLIMKGAASAMKDVPDVNGSWMDTFVRRYDQVDINLVMGTGDGLITPVIRDVGGKGVSQIAAEVNALEDSLFLDHEGEVVNPAAELAPGTFSIHNLGMYGTKAASPIVLPPQSCALALGAIADSVVPCPTNRWKTSPTMTVTLSCDHRVVDGAVAAQWLQAFKTYVENPVGLML